jgi:hypothetical protein
VRHKEGKLAAGNSRRAYTELSEEIKERRLRSRKIGRLRIPQETEMCRRVVFIPMFLLAFVSRDVTAAPQSRGTGTLTGVVIGPDDKPVAHAAVSYQSSGGNAPHAVHTDSRGRFTISELKADNYDIRASHKGIFSDWMKNVTLPRGRTRNVELRLIYAKEMPKSSSKSKPKS